MRKSLVLIAVIAGLAVAGCSSRAKRHKADGGDESSSSSSSGGYTAPGSRGTTGSARGIQQQNATSVASDVSGIGQDRVVYFDYDSATIRPEGLATVEKWANWLGSNASNKVRLEGHADERGTREYNVGLGERRANAVQQALMARGVGPDQLTVISFGEERPIGLGHDESAYAQNRRVEIVD